jgi:hypothetical protein
MTRPGEASNKLPPIVFPNRVAGLRPDVVVDLICFTLDSAAALVERLRQKRVGVRRAVSVNRPWSICQLGDAMRADPVRCRREASMTT